jgi:hypothetical protein
MQERQSASGNCIELFGQVSHWMMPLFPGIGILPLEGKNRLVLKGQVDAEKCIIKI